VAGKFSMRQRKAEDCWRRVSDINNYHLRLREIKFSDNTRFADNFKLSLNVGVTALCGRNGVGKSTVLRALMKEIFREESNVELISLEEFDSKDHTIKIVCPKKNKEKIIYIEPSIECASILEYLNSTDNTEELLEGLDPNGFFLNNKNREDICQIVGKRYQRIEIYEVETAEYKVTFPYIIVTTEAGLKYNCLEMGMGEFLSIYICWYLNWIDRNSILLIEEIENHISAYSQNHLCNYLAYISSSKGIWTVITSHSEHILQNVGLQNVRLISEELDGKTCCLDVRHAMDYSSALGLNFLKKGTILVEDGFAKYVAMYLINHFEHNILDEMDVVFIQNGESNLLKIADHFKPNNEIAHEIICLFDADMSHKVINANKHKVTVLALPSSKKLNPETELWKTAESNYEEIANILRISESRRVLEAIKNFGHLNYHDRFTQIAGALHLKFEVYLDAIMTSWLTKVENNYLALEFIFSLKNRGKYYHSNDEFKESFREYEGIDIDDTKYISINKPPQAPFKAIFDGVQLNFLDENFTPLKQ
jgi:energy-coupling factor transporter ATP-binding protein EcfA2